jgi:hypothetical protein
MGALRRYYMNSTVGPLLDSCNPITWNRESVREPGPVPYHRRSVKDRMKQIEVRKRRSHLSVKNRARRFGIQIHLRYRLSGESKWWKGTTENISRSGVLFRGEEFAEPNTPLEMSFVLPEEIFGMRRAEVVCRGTVIWSERPKRPGVFPALASTISHYRFIRP